MRFASCQPIERMLEGNEKLAYLFYWDSNPDFCADDSESNLPMAAGNFKSS